MKSVGYHKKRQKMSNQYLNVSFNVNLLQSLVEQIFEKGLLFRPLIFIRMRRIMGFVRRAVDVQSICWLNNLKSFHCIIRTNYVDFVLGIRLESKKNIRKETS